MPLPRWSEPGLETTRGRIVALLRRAPMTVDGIATALELTDNAVRSHLATLERDGMVERRIGPRRGVVGKPAAEYRVTDHANEILSRAYLPFLVALMDELAVRTSGDELRSVLRATGRRLAADHPPLSGSLRERATHAARVLGKLGAVAEIEEHDGILRIRGLSCPLGAAVQHHPEVCDAVEALVAALVGVPVTECCDRDDRPRCCFAIAGGSPPRATRLASDAASRRGH